LFRLSTLLWFGSWNHCILSCSFWSKNINILHKTMVYAASIRTGLFFLLFSLMLSQALFMSSL
jgi:hypothetical protein